jgi:hypothetical protein
MECVLKGVDDEGVYEKRVYVNGVHAKRSG